MARFGSSDCVGRNGPVEGDEASPARGGERQQVSVRHLPRSVQPIDLEGARVLRTFSGPWLHVFKVLAASYSLVLIYSVTVSLWSSSTLRGLFIMAITCMIFMRYPATRRSPLHRPSAIDLVLIALSIATFGNFVVDYEEMAWRTGAPKARQAACPGVSGGSASSG